MVLEHIEFTKIRKQLGVLEQEKMMDLGVPEQSLWKKC